MRIPLVVVLSAAAVSAQDITVTTLTNISVLAKSSGMSEFNTVPQNTSVTVKETDTRSQRLAAYNVTANGANGYASLTQSANASYIDIINGKFVRALTATFSHNGTTRGDGVAATSSSATSTGATPGSNSFLVTIRHPSTVTGALLVTWRAQANSKSKSVATVDVGNDNTVDFTADSTKTTSASTSFPADFSKGPMVIKVTVEGIGDANGATGYQNYFHELALNLVKQGTCKLTSYGSSCGGARLDAGILKLGNTSVLSMKLFNGVQNGFFARVVGTGRVNVPLPGNCPLLASPDIITLIRADGQGGYTEAFSMPADTNLDVTFQYVPFDLVNGNLQAMSTNAWELVCSGF